MKSKPVTILLVSFLLIFGISFFTIWPVSRQVWTSYKDLNQTRANLKDIQDKKAALEVLKNNGSVNEIAEIAKKYIPEEADSGPLVIELTAVANNNHLTVEEISLEKEKTSASSQESDETKTSPTPQTSASADVSKAKEVNFKMKLSGSYSDFVKFAEGVEGSSRLIVINILSLQNSATQDAQGFSVQLSGMAYYKPTISIEATLDNIKLSDKVTEQFLRLRSYGTQINLPQESGFGRTNPFETY